MDGAGNAYVIGVTRSGDFPTPGGLQASHGGDADAFVTKINASASAILYSTYLGGSAYDHGVGIAVDSAGNAHVAGVSASSNFPTQNALQASRAGGHDAFLAKINAAGSSLIYSTYFGGTSDDVGISPAVDVSDSAYTYLSGYTSSTNLTTTAGAIQMSSGGGVDVFVAEIGPRDTDGDGVADEDDSCPSAANPHQAEARGVRPCTGMGSGRARAWGQAVHGHGLAVFQLEAGPVSVSALAAAASADVRTGTISNSTRSSQFTVHSRSRASLWASIT